MSRDGWRLKVGISKNIGGSARKQGIIREKGLLKLDK